LRLEAHRLDAASMNAFKPSDPIEHRLWLARMKAANESDPGPWLLKIEAVERVLQADPPNVGALLAFVVEFSTQQAAWGQAATDAFLAGGRPPLLDAITPELLRATVGGLVSCSRDITPQLVAAYLDATPASASRWWLLYVLAERGDPATESVLERVVGDPFEEEAARRGLALIRERTA
jgi:hypothetical protein